MRKIVQMSLMAFQMLLWMNSASRPMAHAQGDMQLSSFQTEAAYCLYCAPGKPSLFPAETVADLFSGYSRHQAIQEMISYAIKNKKKRSHGKCFPPVKKALLNAKLISHYPNIVAPKASGPIWENEGFFNLLDIPALKAMIKSPYDAPEGAILVYSGGKYGHIEIRTRDGFVSEYFSHNARTGSPENGYSGRKRTLIGVYLKGELP